MARVSPVPYDTTLGQSMLSPFDFTPDGANLYLVTNGTKRPSDPTMLLRVTSSEHYHTELEKIKSRGRNAWTTFAGYSTEGSATRRSDAIKSVQCFIMDIDLGTKNGVEGYATKKEALAAVQDAVEKRQLLCPTVIIDSGNGLHLWWKLDAPLTKREWVLSAEALKKYYISVLPRLVIDPARLADAAGLLRAWPSHNYKDSKNPKPVRVVKEYPELVYPIDAFKELYAGHAVTPMRKTKTFSMAAEVPAHLKDIPTKGMNVLEDSTTASLFPASDIKAACKLTRHYISDVVSTADEPAWRAALQIAAYSVEGLEFADEMSRGHVSYDAARTEDKFNKAQQYVAEGAGPYGCEKLRGLWLGNSEDMSQCQGCPLLTRLDLVPNPVNAVRAHRAFTVKKEALVDADKRNVGVHVKVTDATEIENIRASAAVIPSWVANNDNFAFVDDDLRDSPLYATIDATDEKPGRRAKVFNTVWWLSGHDFRNGVVKMFVRKKVGKNYKNYANEVSLSAFATLAKAREVLMKHGAGIPLGAGKEVDYMAMVYINQAIENQMSGEYVPTLGWSDDMESFTVGDITVMNDGALKASMLCGDAVYRAPDFKPKGTLEGHINTLSAYEKFGNNTSKFTAMMGFASPLLRVFSSEMGAIVHLNGNTGKGKTAMLKFVNGIFGDYDSSTALLSKATADTDKGVASFMGVRKNFAVCYDELSNTAAKDIVPLALNFTSGRTNHKRNQNGTMSNANNQSWSCIMVSTANMSLQETLRGNDSLSGAAQARVLELMLTETLNQQQLAQGMGVTIEKFDRMCKQNCGLMGIAFMQHVLPRQEEIAERMGAARNIIKERFGMSSERRFELNTMSAYYVADSLLRELGWWTDSVSALDVLDSITVTADETRSVAKTTVSEEIMDFVRDVMDSTIIMGETKDSSGKTTYRATNQLPAGRPVLAYRYDVEGQTELEFEHRTMRDSYRNKHGNARNYTELYRTLYDQGVALPPDRILNPKRPWVHDAVDFHRHTEHRNGGLTQVIRVRLSATTESKNHAKKT